MSRWAAFLAAWALFAAPVAGALGADPESLWTEGMSALEAGKIDDARRLLQYLAEGYPRAPHAADALLEIARLTVDPDSARTLLERVSRDYPRSPAAAEAVLAMAQADYALGLYEQLLEELRPATAGRVPPATRRRALLLMADAELRSGRGSRAGDDYRKVRELGPEPLEDERALLGLAAVARAEGDLREEARLLGAAAREHPEGDLAAVVLWQWARSFQEQGLDDVAREKMQELVDRFPATPEGGAARDALAPDSSGVQGELPKVLAEHGAELSLWDDAPTESSGVISAADTSRAAAPAQSGVFRVLAGRFATWEAADSLRARLRGATTESLSVSPDREGAPPFSLESAEFDQRGAAAIFATWLESQSGFVSWVVESGERSR